MFSLSCRSFFAPGIGRTAGSDARSQLRAVWTIARREIKGLFDHPTGYILLVVFLVVNDFLFFRQAYLMHLATLRPMLDLMPWVFLFFVPAVTMRALAEEIESNGAGAPASAIIAWRRPRALSPAPGRRATTARRRAAARGGRGTRDRGSSTRARD